MPSRKLTGHCPSCGCKNHLRAAFCNQCGNKLRPVPIERGADQRAKLYADIAHPINSECREQIQSCVIQAYEEELEESTRPGYRSKYDDYFSDAGEDYEHHDDDHQDDSHRSPPTSREAEPPPGKPQHEDDTQPIQRTESASDLKGPHARRSDSTESAEPKRPKFGEGIFED